MTETPDVSADVVERLLGAFLYPICAECKEDFEPGCNRCQRVGLVAVVAHLRAHPEDAAAVLGGEVERKIRDTTNGDLWHAAISPTETDVPVARVVGPWREVPTSEENA